MNISLEVMTLTEIYNKSNDFSGQHLYEASRLVEKFRQKALLEDDFLNEAKKLAQKTANPRLMMAFILYHHTHNIQHPSRITVCLSSSEFDYR